MGRARGVYIHYCYEPAALDNLRADYERGRAVFLDFGADLTGLFALTRGICASILTVVFIFQAGSAVGQPFIRNAITRLTALPPGQDERTVMFDGLRSMFR